MKYLLVLAILLAVAMCAPADDEVHIPIPYTQHKWYSGLLDFSTGIFHYVFFDSQRDPDNDPVVLWLNGGPGCSSLLGMVYENGPFTFKEGTVNFELNPYSWNMKANVLYLESPGGVGFSSSLRGNKHDDATSAEDNYRALSRFFEKFPNLRKNELYLTGESYAGIYVPYLANYIMTQNKLPSTEFKMNLKGIMINNACTDPRECYEPGNDVNMGIYQYENLYRHGYYTEQMFDNIKAACWLGYNSPGCRDIRKIADAKFYATNTSMLNLYAKCLYQKVETDGLRLPNGRKAVGMADDVICEDMYGIQHFFNQATIQAALHVPFLRFDACSDDVANNYQQFENASYWLYPKFIKEGLRVWITSGDIDNSVPITGTMTWITRMRDEFGVPIEEQWREWWAPGLHKHEDQVAGMVWKLRGFTFASVKGAGHMMPKDKKKEAAVLLDCFLNNKDLPDNTP